MIPYTPPAPYIPMPPVRPPARRMGIRMDGCQRPLEDLLRQHVAMYPDADYTLVEVGSANCVTLKAFSEIISEARDRAPWRAVGFDLPVGKAWSMDIEEVRRNGVKDIVDNPSDETRLPLYQMSLILADSPREYISRAFPYPIHFAFIDGCHGKCSGRDFLAVEQKIAPGGVVVFHDYGEIEQGTDWQCHCREFISVRSYVHRLGLASPCNEPRKGWRFVGEIPGSRRNGGDGNSCAVVQRTGEALEVQPALSLD